MTIRGWVMDGYDEKTMMMWHESMATLLRKNHNNIERCGKCYCRGHIVVDVVVVVWNEYHAIGSSS
jgi:hypothetical protein